MLKPFLAFTIAIVVATLAQQTSAHSNDVIRNLISNTVKSKLNAFDSEANASCAEMKRDRTEGPFKWTEETKTWLWLDDPQNQLSVDVTKLSVSLDRIEIRIEAKGKLKGKAWGKVPRIAEGDVKATATTTVIIDGCIHLKGKVIEKVEIAELTAKLEDLQFNNDLLKLLRGQLQDCGNEALKDYCDKLKKQLRDEWEGKSL